MLIMTVNNLSKSYGVKEILKNITFGIESSDRVGLIGVNGAGKSTLFKIIAGIITPDDGSVKLSGDYNIGYLDQNGVFDSPKSIYGELISVFDDLKKLEEDIKAAEQEIASCKNKAKLGSLMDKYSILRETYEKNGGYEYESRVRGVIAGLGFTKEDYDRPVSILSGGEKTRIALGRLLLKKPDILLLDEPTNHLDLSSCEWLEDFLKNYQGSLMVISHDRYFLDKVTNRTFYLKNKQISEYHGNYSFFVNEYEKQRQIDEKAYKNQQKEIERLKKMIETFKARKTERGVRTAESKQKMLDKMEIVEKPESDELEPYFLFETNKESSKGVLNVSNLSKAFEDTLFKNISFNIQKGERVALIGPNGSGKSTIFKIIMDILKPDGGSVQFGNNVQPGYYDQELSNLNLNNDVINELWDDYPGLTQTEVRNILGAFLFRGDDVFKKITDLSGGEKARLCLCKLIMKNANFLLLDEPTNHLDINSKEALETALKKFNGTVLAVSHDRYFVNKIATRILELNKDGITNYLGNYDYYVEKNKKAYVEDDKPAKTKTQEKLDKKKERLQLTKEKELKQRIKDIESEINKTESDIQNCEKQLCDPEIYKDADKIKDVNKKYISLKDYLKNLYDHWAELSEN